MLVVCLGLPGKHLTTGLHLQPVTPSSLWALGSFSWCLCLSVLISDSQFLRRFDVVFSSFVGDGVSFGLVWCVCVCVHVGVCRRMYMHLCVWGYTCVYMYVCACMCIYACVCVCTCVCVLGSNRYYNFSKWLWKSILNYEDSFWEYLFFLLFLNVTAFLMSVHQCDRETLLSSSNSSFNYNSFISSLHYSVV